MTDVAKPTGGCANEIISAGFLNGEPGGYWPKYSESSYLAWADWGTQMAAHHGDKAAQAQLMATFTASENSGAGFSAAEKGYLVDVAKFQGDQDKYLAFAALMSACAQAIVGAKVNIAAAIACHQPIHDAPDKSVDTVVAGMHRQVLTNAPGGKTKDEKDADMRKTIELVKGYLKAMNATLEGAASSLHSGKLPIATAVPNSTAEGGGARPATDPTGTHPAGGDPAPANPGVTQPSTPGPALDPSMFAAPATAPATAGQVPGSTEASGTPASFDPSSMMSGMPAGMPTGGTGGAQQAAGGTPAASTGGASPASSTGGASPLIDSLGQLADSAGKHDGDNKAITPERLEELLKEAGLVDADGKPIDGDGKGIDLDGDGKPDIPGKDGSTTGAHQPAGTPAPNPYTPANMNPALNDPPLPKYLASPSPAAVPESGHPATVSAPMTELSHDVNVPGTNGNGNGNGPAGGPPGPGTPPGSNNGPGNPNVGNPNTLGPYPSAAAPGGPMPMAAPMGAMGGMGALGAMGAGAPAAAAAGSPVLAAAVPTNTEPVAGRGDRAHTPSPPPRISALPPEHSLAEAHLASLCRAYVAAGWATEPLAVAALRAADGTHRYAMATGSVVSLIPTAVALPAGLIPLGTVTDAEFWRDWGGHDRPAAKIVAAAAAGRFGPDALVHLVSNTDPGVRAARTPDGLVESVQTAAERDRLGGGSAAVTPRSAVPGLTAGFGGLDDAAVAALLAEAATALDANPDAGLDPLDRARIRVMAGRWRAADERDPGLGVWCARYFALEGVAAASADDARASLAQLAAVPLPRDLDAFRDWLAAS